MSPEIRWRHTCWASQVKGGRGREGEEGKMDKVERERRGRGRGEEKLMSGLC